MHCRSSSLVSVAFVLLTVLLADSKGSRIFSIVWCGNVWLTSLCTGVEVGWAQCVGGGGTEWPQRIRKANRQRVTTSKYWWGSSWVDKAEIGEEFLHRWECKKFEKSWNISKSFYDWLRLESTMKTDNNIHEACDLSIHWSCRSMVETRI